MTSSTPPEVEVQDPPRRRPLASWPVVGIFTIMLLGSFAYAAAFMIPVTMALLLSLVFTPVRRFMSRRGIPSGISAAVITVAFMGALMGLFGALSVPIADLIDDVPTMVEQIERRFADMRGSFEEIQRTAEQIEEATNGGEETIQAESGEGLIETFTGTAPGIMGQAVFMLVLLFFLIAAGDLFYRKIIASFSTLRDKRRAYAVVREIETSLGSYLGTITLINFALGVCVGLAMWWWGMPSPLLFAAVAFLFNFIPYLGAIAGVAFAGFIALVTFPGWAPIFGVMLTYLTLTAVEGQLITPYFVSRRLRLNTVVVFVAVAFWAWLWSVMGMVMAVPLLVVIRVLCDHIPGLEHVGNFLSAEDPSVVEEDAERARSDTDRS
ncbi:AI-2E family transporter [Paracoccaceae bacterium GXU_MW_L88]